MSASMEALDARQQKVSANIQQRVFDAIPGAPLSISIASLYLLLPFTPRSIQRAVGELRVQRCVEKVAHRTYQRAQNAARPTDNRGWPKGKPR